MADLTDLLDVLHSESAASESGLWLGLIANPVPVVETDPMYVTIPDIDHHVKWGPCRWMPRSMASIINVAEAGEPAHNINVSIPVMPVRGKEALIVFDNRQNIWVVAWQS